MDLMFAFLNCIQVSLAIGFLFLGGGMRTFSTSDSSIAALLITLYPRLPTVPNDNRCHLQVTCLYAVRNNYSGEHHEGQKPPNYLS